MPTSLDLANKAVETAAECPTVFAKFLSPNDTGLTGGHQCGIYLSKPSVPLIFDTPFERGRNQERCASIKWNDDPNKVTNSRFIYYGQGTRNEYRITRFGRGFDLLKPEHTGDLIVICKRSDDAYEAFVLADDDAIQTFLDAFSLSPTETNRLVKFSGVETELSDDEVFDTYYIKFGEDFPNTQIMALSAEEVDRVINGNDIDLSADDLLVRWIETEYRLFRYVEERHYEYVTLEPADSLDSFIKTGLEITNRRKARAGKSLEHHLATIFRMEGIRFKSQATTEVNKKPDFIFPSEEAYRDLSFPSEKLTFLGAKTTCKDRWRQVLNEANRIPRKYLFTLQQGVSPNQLEEMHEENLILVVPKVYHGCYPKTEYKSIISLEEFIEIVRHQQESTR